VKQAAGTVPEQDEAKRIAKRLNEWEEEYFRFIESGIEPTNNEAEITIRQTVLDRVVSVCPQSRLLCGQTLLKPFALEKS
jgi:hypothetical protein